MSRGVKQWLTTPSYASCHYTASYDPELAAKALAPYAGGTIGLLGTYQMSFAMVDHLQKGRFSNSRFVDASDTVDRIKVIKSAEERELVRRAAAMQDGAMRAAFAAIEPGMRDRDVAAIAQCHSQRNGSENGIYLCASMPPDRPAQFSQRHFQNRVIEKGDVIALLVEDSGPGGMYTELGRTCVVGKASAELKDEFAFALEARKFNLDLLKPGTPCKDIFAAYNDFMRKNGRPEEKRLHCHGQGYDLVERPLIRSDEPMTIEKAHEHRRPPDLYPRPCIVVGMRQLSDRGRRAGRKAAPFPRSHHRAGLTTRFSRPFPAQTDKSRTKRIGSRRHAS